MNESEHEITQHSEVNHGWAESIQQGSNLVNVLTEHHRALFEPEPSEEEKLRKQLEQTAESIYRAEQDHGAPITHFVVLHMRVGHWGQGEVLPVHVLPPGADLQRLVSIGAVRPANDFEKGQERVSIKGDRRASVSWEQHSIEKDRTISDLQGQLSEARDEVRRLKVGPTAHATVPRGTPTEILAKDRVIDEQRRQIEALQAQLASTGEEKGGRRRRGE